MKNHDRTTFLILGGCLTMFICAICFVGLSIVGFAAYQNNGEDASISSENVNATRAIMATERAEVSTQLTPTPTTFVSGNGTINGSASGATAVPNTTQPVEGSGNEPSESVAPMLNDIGAPAEINQAPIPPTAFTDLNTLLSANYPINDYYETAVRLGKRDLGSRTVSGPKYQIGDVEIFMNGGRNIEAVLLDITEHAYFWVDTDLDLDQTAVSQAANTFETEYYLPITSMFGEVWQPGVDNDPRFSILHTAVGADDGELGRFSSYDEFPKSVFETSNEQELIYLNLEDMTIGSDLYFGTLVHELQHLIHWHVDSNEALWVNEGLAQLAELTVGLYTSTPADYVDYSDIQLNSWNYDDPELYAHYSAAYLFMTYIWEQLGETAVADLAAHPANGMAGIQAMLQTHAPALTLTDFVGNWAVANYIDDINAGTQYYYDAFDFKKPDFSAEVSTLPYANVAHLDQFGVHYVNLNELRGPVTIKFAGDTTQSLTDATTMSGERMWFAPPVDEMNAHVTAAFDLSSLNRATLEYSLWYDLEADYDYAYISISTDNGENWDILSANDSTPGEFGPAYNGRSTANDTPSGWIKQSISLNAYTGQTVLVRFEVVTDADITHAGIAIDDISIPELNNYIQDVEGSLEGWVAQGFVPIGQMLPQQWSVKLIEDGPEPIVTTLPLDAYNQGEWQIDIGKGGGVLAIVPTTPFISEPANYWLHIDSEN